MEIKMTVKIPNLKVPITCPKCKSKAPVSFREVKPGATKECPNCGATITFEGNDLEKMQTVLDDMAD